MPRKVYIVNKSHHDFSPAEKYGELVFMSEGPLSRYAINDMARRFAPHIETSDPSDCILLSSLNSMNVVAAALFAARHKRLNLLIYRNGRYVERNIVC